MGSSGRKWTTVASSVQQGILGGRDSGRAAMVKDLRCFWGVRKLDLWPVKEF